MATTFTWSIIQMKVYPEIDGKQDFVSSAEWQLTGDNGTNTASTSALFGYKPEDITNFTPYNQLTEETVIGWVKDRLGADGVAHFESIVQTKLDEKKVPDVAPEDKKLPWAATLEIEEPAL